MELDFCSTFPIRVWFLRENNNHNMSGATLVLLGTTFVNLNQNKVYKEFFTKMYII